MWYIKKLIKLKKGIEYKTILLSIFIIDTNCFSNIDIAISEIIDTIAVRIIDIYNRDSDSKYFFGLSIAYSYLPAAIEPIRPTILI